ncbi:MAG TPA: hypothetical protein VEQ65_14355 [Opitutus sp.]|nr:hypothetical protein [Opitutus sp.]
MKRLLLPLSLAAALLAGCDTFDRRSQEKATTFESLSPEEREKLKRGMIEIGNTPDMVYIALGRPDEKRDTATAAGRDTVWIYNTYHREYEGAFHAGYRRHLVYDPVRRRYIVFHEPVYTDVYSDREEEHIRITFRDDRVVQIEQPKPRV